MVIDGNKYFKRASLNRFNYNQLRKILRLIKDNQKYSIGTYMLDTEDVSLVRGLYMEKVAG